MPTAEVYGMEQPPQRQETEIRLIDLATKTDRLLVNEPVSSIRDLSFLPDGQSLVYNWLGINFDSANLDSSADQVRLLNVRTGVARTLVENPGQRPSAQVSPDGTKVAIRYNTLEMPYLEHPCVMVIDIQETDARCIAAIEGASSIPLSWHPRLGIYAKVQPNAGVDDRIELIQESGQRQLVQPLDGARDLSIASDGRMIAWIQTADDEEQVRVANLSNNGARLSRARTISAVPLRESSGGSNFLRGERRNLSWTAVDGVEGSGLLVYPVGYRRGERYPLLVLVHGGPSSRAENVFVPPMLPALIFDYWAAKGYAVLSANYRADGNAGWDALISSRNRGTVLADGMVDILAGVDEVVKLGFVDEARMGVMGHSYGASQVNYIITHTGRFAAAVSAEGTADRQSGWGYAALANPYEEWRYGGPPWERQEAYDRESPFRAVKGVSTPTLFLAGEYGLTGPREYAFMYAAWRRQGVPAAYILYRGERHHWQSPANQRDAAERMTEWIDRYLRP